jgi:hypothetical protein
MLQLPLSKAEIVFSPRLSAPTGNYKLLELNADVEALFKAGDRCAVVPAAPRKPVHYFL